MTSVTQTVHGTVAPGYESVREAFTANFTRFGDQGAACAAHVEGRKVVDLSMNDPRAHRAEWGFGGGICAARSPARMYAACVGEVDGVRLLSPATLADATAEQGDRRDAVLIYPTRWAGGFMLPNPIEPFLGPGSFAFTGAGGHLGLGDKDLRLGFAYTMTAMFGNLTGDPRPRAVLDSLEGCLR